MATAEVLQLQLTEAEAALHRLLTGSQVEELRYAAGAAQRSARYSPANIQELRNYIADLKRQLGQPTRRRAIGVYF